MLNEVFTASNGNKILSANDTVQNQNLIEIAEADFINNDILEYKKDVFVYSTNNVILPTNFLSSKCDGAIIIGLNLPISSLTHEIKKQVVDAFKRTLNVEKSEELVERFALEGGYNNGNAISRYFSCAKDGHNMHDGGIYKTGFSLDDFNYQINIYAGADNLTYFVLQGYLNLPTIEETLSEYNDVLMTMGKKVKGKKNFKLGYCELNSRTGEQIMFINNAVTKNSQIIREVLAKELVFCLEQTLCTNFDTIVFDSVTYNGISIEEGSVFYFKNMCKPNGRAILINHLNKPKTLFFGYLTSIIKFIPEFVDNFKELKKIAKETNTELNFSSCLTFNKY